MGTIILCEHPLIQHKLAMIRMKDTGPKEFREFVEEIAMLMCYEATRDMPLSDVEIETPISLMNCKQITTRKYGVVPILRAGLGMVDGFLNLMPTAKVGHVGLYRDPETLQPVEYYCKLPVDVEERDIFIMDPMLATGGTASEAIQFIKERGVKNIKFVCLLACPEGIAKIQKEHPDVDIYTAAIDERLNEHGYIVPGLGDAGDRLFGTK